MKRTVSALYETQADAERALEALRARGLAEHAEIHDEKGSTKAGPHGKEGAMGRLRSIFGHHRDTHTYAEGLRRGHFLLTAHVEEGKETLAAEEMDAAQPVNLGEREQAWRAEGWSPAADHRPQSDSGAVRSADEVATSFGSEIRVRSYISGDAIEASTPR
jgi:hypothetical protein